MRKLIPILTVAIVIGLLFYLLNEQRKIRIHLQENTLENQMKEAIDLLNKQKDPIPDAEVVEESPEKGEK